MKKTQKTNFRTGQHVFYPPILGVVKIVAIETIEVAGSKIETYHVVSVVSGEKVLVPKSKAEQNGLRPLGDRTTLQAVVDTLKEAPKPVGKVTHKKIDALNNRLDSGDLLKIAEVLRDCSHAPQSGPYAYSNAEYVERGMQLLVPEVAIIRNCTIKEAVDYLSSKANLTVPEGLSKADRIVTTAKRAFTQARPNSTTASVT